MSNLTLRIVSAVVLVPIVLAAVYLGGYWLAAFIACLMTLTGFEWRKLDRDAGSLGLDIATFCVVAGAYLFAVLEEYSVAWLIIAVTGAVLTGAAGLGVPGCLWRSAGLVYLMPLPVALLWLREAAHSFDGAMLIFWIFITVWATDTGAYFGGRGIGGPKLAPRISPGKTWSGAIVGALTGAAAGTVFALGALGVGAVATWVLCGLALASWSQLGDLFESAIKRKRGIKDSGAIIPGHGGVLDRVDSLLFAVPGVAVILWIIE